VCSPSLLTKWKVCQYQTAAVVTVMTWDRDYLAAIATVKKYGRMIYVREMDTVLISHCFLPSRCTHSSLIGAKSRKHLDACEPFFLL